MNRRLKLTRARALSMALAAALLVAGCGRAAGSADRAPAAPASSAATSPASDAQPADPAADISAIDQQIADIDAELGQASTSINSTEGDPSK